MYKFKKTSPAIWILTLLLTIFLGIALLIILVINKVFLLHSIWIIGIALLPFIVLAFILPRYTSTANLQIKVEDSFLEIKGDKSIIFREENKKIKWTEIKEYVYQVNRQFDKFEILLKDNSKLIWFHNNDSDGKDDFIKFIEGFKTRISEMKANDHYGINIQKGKTFYEKPIGMVLAVFAGFLVVIVTVIILNHPKMHNYSGIAIIYLGAIFYISKVAMHRTSK